MLDEKSIPEDAKLEQPIKLQVTRTPVKPVPPKFRAKALSPETGDSLEAQINRTEVKIGYVSGRAVYVDVRDWAAFAAVVAAADEELRSREVSD